MPPNTTESALFGASRLSLRVLVRASIVLATLAWPLPTPFPASAAGAHRATWAAHEPSRTPAQEAPRTGSHEATRALVGETQAAGECRNEAARIEQPLGLPLPDCRAYEQVSPVQKNLADALGAIGGVRGAPDGEAVTYDSLGAFPLAGGASEGSSQLFSSYLAVRGAGSGAEGWLTQSLGPPVLPGASAEPVGVSEDLRFTFERSENEPPFTPEGVEGEEAIYMRDNATGAERLLFQLPAGEAASFYLLADGAEDSRVFFESSNRLSAAAAPGVPNLYEWHEGALSLVDLLPGGAGPDAGGGAGARGPGAEGQAAYFDENAVSEDGSTAYFTDLGTGRIYVRSQQPGGEGETIAISSGPASWQGATPDGSEVFYIQEGVLYRFQDGASLALSPAGGEALGVLGISNDGAYVYFAARGVLASQAVAGDQNIYLLHEGAISLVSVGGEEADWATHASAERAPPDEGVRSARVSADGQTLMFTSRAALNGYDNDGQGADCFQAGAQAPCTEIYVYQAGAADNEGEGALTCVSCNPSGAPATHEALLYHLENDGFFPPPTLSPAGLPRNLSADGSRVFFETEEALLPSDSDGQMDVYEWELAGDGSCAAGEGGGGADGCLYLISTGTSEEPSYFAEASMNGDDVFFFTRQSLLAEDQDALVDLYDARVGGGLQAQNRLPSTAECSQESCHPPQAPLAGVEPPASEIFAGPGDRASSVKALSSSSSRGHKKLLRRKPGRRHSRLRGKRGASHRKRTPAAAHRKRTPAAAHRKRTPAAAHRKRTPAARNRKHAHARARHPDARSSR